MYGGLPMLLWVLALAIIVILLYFIIRIIRKNMYFASERFQTLKANVANVVAEHNDIASYIEQIRAKGSFELGRGSSSGQYAHLASFENTSQWNYRRDRNVAKYAPHIHNASLQIVRSASADPLKYLMKYFSISAEKETLADVQQVANDIARLEGAVANIQDRERDLIQQIAPPSFILKHYRKEFWYELGIELAPIAVPYPQYEFRYVSAGGNSSQRTRVQLDTPTLEALSSILAEKIRWGKSAAAQRALMTARLREAIKRRDNYTCRYCHVSVAREPHLLLEVDHITPVARGGLSTPENLQTLCWRCNRSKGARVDAPSGVRQY